VRFLILTKDEVCDIRWVDAKGLQDMLADSQLKWSPWFRLIVDNHLMHWWQDVDTAINTNKFEVYDKIYRYI
jgi:isopentenyl-diphosphate delta-isomerase